MVRLREIQPVLHVRDVKRALAYYALIGFDSVFTDDEANPHYAGVARDGIEIHLQWHHASEWEVDIDRPQIRILTEGVDALYEELQSKVKISSGGQLRDTAWGTREFGIYDPDQNALIFYTDK
ncbi:glyoxalase superfamily protein [Croceiramulus getboli]|nr:glyoxalase superfamily protein [Flavobacteriaceae bacterium YJPT1-3]